MEFETYAHEHIVGALYGQALGDAWAMPAYIRPEQTWDHFDGWIGQLLPAPDDHPLHAGLKAGQVTGDTHLAMAIAQAVITSGQITAEGAATALIDWYDKIDSDHPTFIDPNTRRIVSALKSDTLLNSTGLDCNTHLAAIGIAPIGLIHAGNADAAVEDAIIACNATHFTNIAISGACAVAAAVAQAVTPNTTLEKIIDEGIRGAQVGIGYGHSGLGASVARKIELAVKWALEAEIAQEARLQNLHDFVGVTLSAADVVPCAFGVLAMAYGNPVETVALAANLSGKANTVGAIAGAIAGAWKTIETIPTEYTEILRQANPQLNFEETAEGLFEIAKKNFAATPQHDENSLTASFLDELK